MNFWDNFIYLFIRLFRIFFGLKVSHEDTLGCSVTQVSRILIIK